MSGAVARKRDLTGSAGLGEEQLHAGDHPLERTLALEPDVERRVLPQDHVMLEKHWHAAVEPDVQHRHQLSVDAVVHTRGTPVGDGGGQYLWGLRSIGRVGHRRGSGPLGVASEEAGSGNRRDDPDHAPQDDGEHE